MEPEALSYPEALSKLLGMLERSVEVTIRGAGPKPPLFIDFEGTLQRGEAIEAAEVAGWDEEAVQIRVNEVRMTLHPTGSLTPCTCRPRGAAG